MLTVLFSVFLTIAHAEPVEAPVDEAPVEVPTGPVEVMLLYGDVGATVKVAGITTGVPVKVELPQGTHEARITTSNGQLVVKRIEVGPPTGATQVIQLGQAQAAGVQGHPFRFEVPGKEGAVVFVDEAEAGVAPIQVLLSPGAHLVEVQGPDGVRTGGEMTLKPGATEPTVIVLK